jgi:putative tryptophan/tyrosine transport system substrate-binding protein
VRRRDFVTLLGGTAFMQAFAALAQKAPVRLGFLCACAAGSRTSTALIADINGGLRENGLIEGRDYILETRFVAGHYERFAPFAQELTQGGVSILLVNTIVAVRAAQQVIPPVSVVMLYVHDPVGTGLIASLSRPGGLTTGMATMIEDITPKLLDFQRMIVPGAKVIAALFNPVNPTNPPIVEDLKIRASATGLTVQPIVLRMPEELNTVFSAIVATQADTVHVIADASVMDLIDRIAAFSVEHRLPCFSTFSYFAEFGGLLAYGPSISKCFRRGGYFTKRILAGANPGDLPVEQPTQIELSVNLITARSLAIDVPVEIQQLADRVIE